MDGMRRLISGQPSSLLLRRLDRWWDVLVEPEQVGRVVAALGSISRSQVDPGSASRIRAGSTGRAALLARAYGLAGLGVGLYVVLVSRSVVVVEASVEVVGASVIVVGVSVVVVASMVVVGAWVVVVGAAVVLVVVVGVGAVPLM